MMVPALPCNSLAAMSNSFLRSSSDIEKNSPCLPATNTPSIFRSPAQCRRFERKPVSSMAKSCFSGVSAAAHTPFILAWA